MVFVAGPRQVGKTTFARSLPGARAGYQTPEGIRVAPALSLLKTLV
jgi:predicted AAA+ superfamily ATPase